jgi:hypothetical protein
VDDAQVSEAQRLPRADADEGEGLVQMVFVGQDQPGGGGVSCGLGELRGGGMWVRRQAGKTREERGKDWISSRDEADADKANDGWQQLLPVALPTPHPPPPPHTPVPLAVILKGITSWPVCQQAQRGREPEVTLRRVHPPLQQHVV